MNGPDYIVDIEGLRQPAPDANGPSLRGRPWVAVRWRCCEAYTRIYRNREGTAYEGRCPACGRPVRFLVGEGGTSHRFFEAT